MPYTPKRGENSNMASDDMEATDSVLEQRIGRGSKQANTASNAEENNTHARSAQRKMQNVADVTKRPLYS